MHLFVGNLSKSVKVADLEVEFDKFGRCKVKIPKVSSFSALPLEHLVAFMSLLRRFLQLRLLWPATSLLFLSVGLSNILLFCLKNLPAEPHHQTLLDLYRVARAIFCAPRLSVLIGPLRIRRLLQRKGRRGRNERTQRQGNSWQSHHNR